MCLRRAFPAAVILLLGFPAWAEETASPETASYVVRPGDTLRDLTARYLGTQERWEENWRLNPHITNPNLITPNDTIKLLVPPKLPEDGALLTRVSNRVEAPIPKTWLEELGSELLRARDGIRTYEASSAQLRFRDETLLTLTEDSTLFLGEERRTPEQVDRTQIVIEVGQADLEGPAVAADTAEFEIIIGDAKATPRAGEDSALQTRARKAKDGAQLMVYGGESELEAGGGKVQVGTGMGSSVPEGKPPAPPEKLLPAPAGLEPGDGTRIATPQPSFRWHRVEGARDYTIEVCRDPRCGSLVERVQELTEPSWRPAGLPVEKLYWRVTAISPSGLDGFPSDALALEILTAVPDATPPSVAIGFTGPQLAPRGGLNRSWIVGPGMEVEVEVEDAESGVAGWTASLDGEEISADALAGPWEKGEHTLKVTARDLAGNPFETEVAFVYDPDPPALSWGAEGDSAALGILEGASAAAAARRDLRGRRQLRAGRVDWQLDSDLAQIRLRPLTRKPINLEGLGAFGHRQGLWVLADDEVCPDLESLTYDLVDGAADGEYVLWTKAVDCVGNSIVGQLPLVRKK